MVGAASAVLEEGQWRELEKAHRSFIEPWIDAYSDRRSRGKSHPVHDFLFSYYHVKRSKLLRWNPMPGVRLRGSGAEAYLADPRYRSFEDGVGLDPSALSVKERERIAWIVDLIEKALVRPPRFNCFGLHEWAMVYRADQVRHETTPLRVTLEEAAKLVESMPLCCTHFDAYRFFTEKARPMNASELSRDDCGLNEQFGCMHFNMDLYKWCYKAMPWIGSELMDVCFRLAVDARVFDMRASPYDVSTYGYAAIPVETAEGREQYRREQIELHRRGQPLARRLLAELNSVL